MKPIKIEDLHIELLVDFEGNVTTHVSGNFVAKEFAIGSSIYTTCPFLISTLEALPFQEPLSIEGMLIASDNVEYNIDIDLFKSNSEVSVLIHNRTNVYKFVNHLNQGRNDLYFLKRELAEKNKELVRLREAADKANKAKSRFLAMMSHEVRNPLNVILGYTELINKEETSLMVQEYLKYLTISGQNLRVIVDDILDLSRVEAGKLQLAKDPVNIAAVLDQIQKNYESSHKDSDVKLLFEPSENLPESIFGDDVRIIQILTNLINNSIKFTPRGTVTTSVEVKRANKEEVLISFRVKDNGRGMTEEQASKIFEEYQQNRLSDNRLHKGVGLGLSIVKRLVDQMGGEIKVDSFLNYGTTFIVDIPFTIDNLSDADNADSGVGNKLKSLRNKKILVADDNFLNLTIVSHILQKENADFILVKDGIEAEKELEKATFDVVLLDINMPNLSGDDLIKRVKENAVSLNAATPFLALTANNSDEEIANYKSIGFKEVIPKPFTSEQFKDGIKQFI